MAGTEHVYFDWNDQKTYRDALKNTNSLYLVAPVGVFEPSPLVVPFLEMAAAFGVRRIVLLSAAIIDEDGPVFGKLHHAVRRYVPEWTVLEPSYFMQNFDHQHGASIRKKNEIVTASGSGKVGFIDADDIAEVAVCALLDQKPHNTSHILTGPKALSYAEAAAIIGRAAGRDVRHVNVEVSALRERYIKVGLSPDYASFMSELDEKIKNGKENRITDTVERVTEKKPRSLADFANEHAGRWRLL
ncbi:NAD(P)H azoreductase [Bacillus paralicheniformis]|nr:NAD(P)H azoreductase [Bacillus paralicheniformis]